MAKKSASRKLELVQAISALYGGPPEMLGPGSKEHKPMLVRLAAFLGLPIKEDESKQTHAKKIVEAFGGTWDVSCESGGPRSQTITEVGLQRLYEAALKGGPTTLVRDTNQSHVVHDEHPPEKLALRSTREIEKIEVIRDVKFRRAVLDAWGTSCRCCSISEIRLIDAAHILAVANNGGDVVPNGIPLCALHHRMFDNGMLQIEIDGVNRKAYFFHPKELVSKTIDAENSLLWPCRVKKEILLPKTVGFAAFSAWYRRAEKIKNGKP